MWKIEDQTQKEVAPTASDSLDRGQELMPCVPQDTLDAMTYTTNTYSLPPGTTQARFIQAWGTGPVGEIYRGPTFPEPAGGMSHGVGRPTPPPFYGPYEYIALLDRAMSRPKPLTKRSDLRLVPLWDFLCKTSFEQGRNVPEPWVKDAIQRYLDYADHAAIAREFDALQNMRFDQQMIQNR